MSERFVGKVAIITGAAGDIGTAVATWLAREGAHVVAVDMDEAGVTRLAADLLDQGLSCKALVANVSLEDDVKQVVADSCNAFGGVDILFNNAGIEGEYSCVSECSLEDFDRVMAVNVRGVLLGMKYVVPEMQSRGGGSIVNTASVAGLKGAAGLTAYSASKHAVIGMTRSVAKQQGPNNIRVNAVCPAPVTGRMMTSIENKMLPDDAATAHELVQASVPMGRYATSADVASMVIHLCSDEASFLNGGVYTVDGGVTA
jgi:3alpha(or 20beta)-hydroxysteroid dehydrogenase